MGAILLVAGIGIVLIVIGRLNVAEAVSPDGHRYRALARREPVPVPFALRWLLPLVLGDRVRRWRACQFVHLAALPPLLVLWLRPWVSDSRLQVVGALLVCGLSGVWRIHLRWPVLVDGPAMAWALGSAVLWRAGQPVAAIAVALVAAGIKESAPVFAACYAWHPLPLLALVVPLVRWRTARVGEDLMGQPHVTHQPVLASRIHHLGRWFDARSMLLPWGAGILAALATDRQVVAMLVVTAALAYGQLAVATDTIRLYQWAAPPVILAAATVLPARWAVLALLLHLFNPWAGTAEV